MTIHLPIWAIWTFGLIFIVPVIGAFFYDSGWQNGQSRGFEEGKQLIELKIRQRALILDGKRVVMIKDTRKQRRSKRGEQTHRQR